MSFVQTTKKIIQRKAREALGIEKGFFGFKAEPKFGMYDKVKKGDYVSMLEANYGRIWACVHMLSIDLARVPLELFLPGKDEDKQVFEHPFFELLKKEPFHTTFELKYLLNAHKLLTGNAYLYTPLNAVKRPIGIRFLSSPRVTPKFDEKTLKKYYEYDDKGKIRVFQDEEITHFKIPNPESELRGMGPLEAARKDVNLLEYMKEYQITLLGSRAIPAGILSLSEDATEGEMEKIKTAWKKKYGGVEKINEIAVFNKGAEFKPIMLSPEDLQFLRSVEFTQEEIGAIFGVPPQKLGRVQDVNRANSEAVELSYQKDTITPHLIMNDIVWTEEIVQKYDTRLIVRSPNVVPEDKIFELQKDKDFLSLGVFTINQVLKKNGYDPVPEGDVRLIPFNLVPLDTISYAPPEEESEKSIKAYSTCSYRNKEWRDQYWKAYVGRTIKQERGMISVLGRFFEAQKDEVISNLHKYGKAYKAAEVYLPSRDAADRKIIATLKPIILSNVVKGGESLAIDFHLFAEGEFQANTIFIENFFKSREMLIKNINETTFEKLTTVINEAVNNGETIAEISQKVERVYVEAKGPRSRLIARTEVNTGVNFGHMEAMRQAAIEEKEWVTAGDERVRDTHIMNQNDGCIPMEHVFSGTGESSPGEFNCRCVVIPCMG